MVEREDYDVIGNRHGQYRLDGTSSLNAAWVFHPMPNDNERWLPKVIQQITQDDTFKTPGAKLLILPPGFDTSCWSTLLRMYFNEAWQLKPHLMLGSGTHSTYPSLRAERSIRQTLATFNLKHLRHYWPAASLDPKNYRPMADDQTLREPVPPTRVTTSHSNSRTIIMSSTDPNSTAPISEDTIVLTLPVFIKNQLNHPFERDDIRNDAHMSGDDFRPRYPAAPALIRRLNEVFGHLWSDEIIRVWDSEDGRQVLVHCRLSIPTMVDGQVINIIKDGFGMAFLKLAPNGQGCVNCGYDLKAAHTDALRKAATKLGIIVHVDP